MLQRISAIIKRDMKSSFRDPLIIYIIISPLLLAFLLRGFIPSVDSASVQFAVLGEDHYITEQFERYGRVEVFESRENLEYRVNATDDIVGVIDNKGQYDIILEGNESEGLKAITEDILMDYDGYIDLAVGVQITDIDWQISTVALVGAASLIMLATLLGGMLTGLNIVEEKQFRTISAIRVSPVTTLEFLLAKSVPGLVIPIVQSILMFIILGFTDINWLMTVAICVFSSLIGLIIGVLLGVINNDPLTAAGGLKILMLPMSATIIGALLLPQKLLFLLYWIPYYWTYEGVTRIMLKTATWLDIMGYSAALVFITLLVFLALRKRIQRGLAV